MKKTNFRKKSRAALIATLLFLISGAASAKPNDPGRDNPSGGKCATFASKEEKKYIYSIINYDKEGRPVSQKQARSPKGHFLIHYDKTGVHAVALNDLNNNGIPDYIDSVGYYFEYAAEKYIERGFPQAYPDNGLGGDSSYDVYIKNIGDGVRDSENAYGGYYGLTECAGEIDGNDQGSYSFIVIDNDYSEKDSLREGSSGKAVSQAYKEYGILGMKITAAHEYMHAIQFVYGIEQCTGPLLAEMTSVYMEYTIFPESRDHKQYVDALLKNPQNWPFSSPIDDVGRSYNVFIKYLTEKFGEDAVRLIWEAMGEKKISKNSTYRSLDMFLRSKGSDLKTAWLDFLPWLYYTGARAKDGYLPLAAVYKEMLPRETIIFTDPENNYQPEELRPFQLAPVRYIFKKDEYHTDDTLDIIATNMDIEGLLVDDKIADNDFYKTISIGITIRAAELATSGDPIFDYEPPTHYLSFASGNELGRYIKFEGQGKLITAAATAFPTPLLLKTNSFVYFPLPENTPPYSLCSLSIRDLAGASVYLKELRSGVYNGVKSVLVETLKLSDKITTGVYIFSIAYGGNTVLGKFAVVDR